MDLKYMIEGINNLFKVIDDVQASKFIFYIDNEQFECNQLLASFISPIITKNIIADKTTCSFDIKTNDFLDDYQIFVHLITHFELSPPTTTPLQNISKRTLRNKIKSILHEIFDKLKSNQIDTIFSKIPKISNGSLQKETINDFYLLYKIFILFGNTTMAQQLMDTVFKKSDIVNKTCTITNENDLVRNIVMKEIIHQNNIGIEYSAEIEYINKHFIEMNTDILNKIPEELIEEAIKRDDFQIPDEDSFFYKIIELNDKIRTHFLQFVEFSFLSQEAIKTFLSEIQFSEININLWNSISVRLSHELDRKILLKRSNQTKRYLKLIENTDIYLYSEMQKFHISKGNEFKGIFDYLNNKSGGNAHLKNEIIISSNGDNLNHCYNLIDKNFESCFSPDQNKESYIQFDMKNYMVSLNNYSLKSDTVYTDKLINWEIIGSNDGINWDQIDERHISPWEKSKNIAEYSTNNHNFYRYFRLRLKGRSSSGGHFIYLTSIEFFGTLAVCK